MTQGTARRCYEFGEFRLDPQRRTLCAKGSEQPLAVTGKIFDTLLYFVEHPGELLEKRKLLEVLWPNVVVEESNLTQTIHTLRRLLEERRGERRFIVTVPGRGYRFVADVAVIDTAAREQTAPAVPAPSEPDRARRAWPMGVTLAIAVIALSSAVGYRIYSSAPSKKSAAPVVAAITAPSVAVLPFVDMSAEQNQQHFAEGLSEEILNLLAQSSSMRIIARTSSFSFKRQDLDVATIARELGATHVLEGSVRKSGNKLRITAQLVDGRTSGHLWSQTYDRDQADVFLIQDEIAAAVSDSLHATLNPNGNPQRAETTSSEAFEHYLRARYLFNRGDTSDIDRARDHFKQALQIDPEYARAWSGLAGTYHATLGTGSPTGSSMQREWLHSVERGLSLGPGIAETHVRAAQYHWWTGSLKLSDQHCKLAIGLNPSDSLVLSVQAIKEVTKGQLDQAILLQRRAVAIDPLSVHDRAALGVYLASAGKLEEAEAELRKASEISATPSISADLGRVLSLRRQFDEALAIAEKMPDGADKDQVIALANYGKGNEQAGDLAINRLLERAKTGAVNINLQVMIAEIFAHRGDPDRALEWLERLLSPDSSSPPNAVAWRRHKVLASPFFTGLRDDARWQRLMSGSLE